jgi:hypothetical protein
MSPVKFLMILHMTAGIMSVSGQPSFQGTLPEEAGKKLPDWNGYVRSSVYGPAREYPFTTFFAEAGIKMKYVNNNGFLLADLRFRGGYRFDEEFSELEAKELFAGIAGRKGSLFIGNQIVEWGRTDGFNPTNNLTPVNYFFLSAEPDDQKMATFLCRLKYRISKAAELDAVAIPVYKPSVYRFELFDMGDGVKFTDPVMPSKKPDNSSFALQLNVQTGAADFSVSWFRGYDPFHGFGIRNLTLTAGTPEITYAAMPYRKNTPGLDFAIPLGSWIIKGEGCFNIVRNARSREFIPFSNLQLVAGVERNIAGFQTIIQYVGQFVPDFRQPEVPVLLNPADPQAVMKYGSDLVYYRTVSFNRKIFRQEKSSDHGLTLTLSRSFAYETWKTDLATFYDLTSKEYYLRLGIGWNISDALSLKACGFTMDGPDGSVFDYAGRIMSGVCLECKVNF